LRQINFLPLLGGYLGYATREKFRVRVPHISDQQIYAAEKASGNAEQLAMKLFLLVFKGALEEKPSAICCTESKGKELLNQDYLRGIRCRFVL